MNMEKGMEAIIHRIESDVEGELAVLNAAFEKELGELAAAHLVSLRKVEKDAAEKASQISEKELQRGHSAAISVSRGVLSETKSALVKHAFEMAAESFVSMEEHRYLSIMAPMLAAAVREFPEDADLTLVVPATHPVTGDALIRAAGVSAVGKTETRDELVAGFLLCSDTLEIDCTPSKLIFDRYDVLSPRVAEILFAKEG